jgi:hypothetical protein
VRSRQYGRKRVTTFSAACVVVLALGVAVVARPASSIDQTPKGNAARCPSPTGATVVRTVRVPGRPGFMLLEKRALWVAIHASPRGVAGGHGAIVRINTDSGRVDRVLHVPIDPYQLAFGFGSLWVTGETNNRVYQDRLLRIDPTSGRVLLVIRGPVILGSKIATTSDAVWINGADIFPPGHSELAGVRFVYKIDPRRNIVVRRVRLPGQATVIDLLGEGSSLWAAGWWGVIQLSASGRPLFRQPINGAAWSIALTPGAVWVVEPWLGTRPVRRQNRPARRLLRISRSGQARVTSIDLQTQPGGVSAAAGVVWLAASGGLARVDLTVTPPTVVKVDVTGGPADFAPSYHAAFAGGVWVAEQKSKRVSKIC